MDVNHPELAKEDRAFRSLVYRRSKQVRERHLLSLTPYVKPEFRYGDWDAGHRATSTLIEAKTPIIHKPVFLNHDFGLLAMPNLLIRDDDGYYTIRDVKLARNLGQHKEIALQVGLHQLVSGITLGYLPDVEVVAGDGTIYSINPLDPDEVLSVVSRIVELRNGSEPDEPVGWSKCEQCAFAKCCWSEATKTKCIATIPYVDQSAARVLKGKGYSTYEHMNEFSEELLAEIERPWGQRMQKIGKKTALKIKRQVRSLLNSEHILEGCVELPLGYHSGQRPVVMFDIENDVFDPDLGVKVYLWGCLVATENDTTTKLIVSDKGVPGDRDGWFRFLSFMDELFNEFGDLPLVHYSHHEKTWVTKYIERYGDKNGAAQRVLDNLWDMQACIKKNMFLPVHSYGLKHIEGLTDFVRSQEEYGGLWSIITYDRYLHAQTAQESESVLKKITTYNTEYI